VEAVVTIDERGQMVLPKDLRDRAGIKAGDRMAAVSYSSGGRVCCIALIRVEELTDLVTTRLQPLLRGVGSGPAVAKR
jgi:AbrB family looped-hinge helix DNA binding protein